MRKFKDLSVLERRALLMIGQVEKMGGVLLPERRYLHACVGLVNAGLAVSHGPDGEFFSLTQAGRSIVKAAFE